MGKKVLVELSHPFGADMPLWPYFSKPKIDTMHNLSKSGVLTQKIDVVMHCGTHADAPRHVMEREFNGKRARYVHELPLDAYYGDAVCLDVRVGHWELIKPKHLEEALARVKMKPKELKGMVLGAQNRHAPEIRRQQRILPLFLRLRQGSRRVVCEDPPEMCGHGPAGTRPSFAYGDGAERPQHESSRQLGPADYGRIYRTSSASRPMRNSKGRHSSKYSA